MYNQTSLPNQYQISDLVFIYYRINFKINDIICDQVIFHKTFTFIAI